MDTLSEPAVALLRRRWAGEPVPATDDTRPHYRELAAAGLMEPISGFARGPEANFRFTEAGWNLRETLAHPAGSPAAASGRAGR